MAEQTPEPLCPSCGSSLVAQISLTLIPALYYECTGCKLTFRHPPVPPHPPDIDRFNDGWTLSPDKPKK